MYIYCRLTIIHELEKFRMQHRCYFDVDVDVMWMLFVIIFPSHFGGEHARILFD
jgi:hypothetical protein